MHDKIKPVILCGGSGTRLWPLSTPRTPKQFLPLCGPNSMLVDTLQRIERKEMFSRPLVIGSERHRNVLHAEVGARAQLLFEPMGRNSAAAVAIAALVADPGRLVLIMPADHAIADPDAFHTAISAASGAARDGKLITFGITADAPATGYGYIQAGGPLFADRPTPVARFVEKPDRQTAEQYLSEGGYFWNGGIFLFRAGAMIDALERFAPSIITAVRTALVGAPGEEQLDPDLFAKTPSDSIDYAVMEHADNIEVMPVDMGWTDVGDHDALFSLNEARSGLRLSGPAAATGGDNVFIRAHGPVVGVHGVSDIAVIATRDAVLVTRRGEAAGIRNLVEQLTHAPQRAMVGEALRGAVASFLDRLLGHWADIAWDPENGGFIEAVGSDGRPVRNLSRRGRIAPRQIFTFAAALQAGWNPDGRARALVDDGLAFLDERARSPQGGWAHKLSSRGKPEDPRRDLYDHAFVALAAAKAFSTTGAPLARTIAEEAFAIIDGDMRDLENGGWYDPETGDGAKRANPHMHLLEASLAWFEASNDQASLRRAEEIACLFEESMFDARTGAVLEVFRRNWARSDTAQGRVAEPGHCYEWAYLLSELERLSGRDTLSWRRRLIGFADRHGRNEHGCAYDAVSIDGEPIASSRRLWPQLEMVRARLSHADTGAPGQAERELQAIFDTYLKGGREPVWIDTFDADGEPVDEQMPASMPYHLMTALAWTFQIKS